jgi:hypothetical protein
MRGGFPLKQALKIPSPAGGRGPGRGWARFTSPPPGERPGAGGVFFSFNLCPLYACHSVPLFSPRSCPMNGQDMGLRIWRTPRYPRSNQRPPRKPAPFFGAHRNQTPPQKEGPQPFRAGGGKRGPCLNHWMGKNGDRSPFCGYKRRLFALPPHGGTRAPVKRRRLIHLPSERQAEDGPPRVEAPRRTNARRGALNAPQLLPPVPTFPAPLHGKSRAAFLAAPR